MAGGGSSFKCYIVGTTHFIAPDESLVEKVLSEVDYVVLEEVERRIDTDSLVERITAVPVLLGLLVYIVFLLLAVYARGLAGLLLEGRGLFHTDQDSVFHAVSRGWSFTRARPVCLDPDLGRLVERVKLKLLVFETAVLPPSLYSGLSLSDLAGLHWSAGLVSAAVLHSILSMGFFVLTTSRIRDDVVAEGIVSLREAGARGVLVVRGRDHVGYLRRKLAEAGVECVVLG